MPPPKFKHKIFWKASLLLFCPRSSCQLYFEFLRGTVWSRPAEGNVSHSILHIVFSYDTHAISHGKLTPPIRTSMHLCICINSQKQEPGIEYNTQKSCFPFSPFYTHVIDLFLTFLLELQKAVTHIHLNEYISLYPICASYIHFRMDSISQVKGKKPAWCLSFAMLGSSQKGFGEFPLRWLSVGITGAQVCQVQL